MTNSMYPPRPAVGSRVPVVCPSGATRTARVSVRSASVRVGQVTVAGDLTWDPAIHIWRFVPSPYSTHRNLP